MNFISFSVFVIPILVVGILEQKERPTRYLKVIFIGLLFFKDAYHFCKSCEKCQRTSNITHKNQMPLRNFLVSEIFMFGVLILWVHFLLLHS
jgi:hypothetical protein